MDVNQVQELRQQMAAAGWSPVPLVTGDKAVKIPRWSDLARQDRNYFAQQPARPDMLNTGFLCDGLRVVDIRLAVAVGVPQSPDAVAIKREHLAVADREGHGLV